MTPSYHIQFLKFLYLWDEGGARYVTTCECAPFVACGCKSLKLSMPRFTIGGRLITWTFEIYVLGLWAVFVRRRFFRSKACFVRFICGYRRSVKLKSFKDLGGLL